MKTFRLIGMALFAVLMCVNFASCSSDEEPPTITLKTSIINADYIGGTYSISFSSNCEHNITFNSDKGEWISIKESTSTTESIIDCEISPNIYEESREGTIIFKNGMTELASVKVIQEKFNSSLTVNMTESGTLEKAYPQDILDNIISLKIIGEINGNDLSVIRKITGYDLGGAVDENLNPIPARKGKLTNLDLSEAKIVNGGKLTIEGNQIEFIVDNDIPKSTFYGCTFTNLILPSNITSIKDYALSNCKFLTNLQLPNSIQVIGRGAFSGCSNLESIKMSNNITDIDFGAFMLCKSLKNITLPEKLKFIGEAAFENCSSLTEITIPGTVTNIGEPPFAFCNKLESINVDSNNAVYSSYLGCLYNKEQTIFIRCPEAKKDITYPNNIKEFTKGAFCNNLAESLTIPKTVEKIGKSVFLTCDKLKTIYCKATIPPTLSDSSSLPFVLNFVTIYVPQNSLTAYKNADIWKDCLSYHKIEGYNFN